MKKLFCAITLFAIAASLGFSTLDPLAIGSKMPKGNVKMKSVSGKEISINEELKDKGILVMFSCNTCPYVIKNQQRTKAIADFAQKMNVGIILLNSNEALRNDDDAYTEMKKYAAAQKYSWNYVVDKNSEVANAFGASRTPECFLFDKNFILVYHGAIDDSPSDPASIKRQHLKEAIKELIEGKEITIKETKSVGCGIKRTK